jgi:hypothetical protein
VRRCSTDYLLEESALFSCLVDAGMPVFVYPGAIKTFQRISEGEFAQVPESLRKLVFVALRLEKAGLYAFDHPPADEPATEAIVRQASRGAEPDEFAACRDETSREWLVLGAGA